MPPAEGDRLIRQFRPDVVHVHKAYVQLSVAPVVVAARHGVPIVQTAHDYEFISASPVDSTGGRWDRNESRFSYRALNSTTMLARRFVHRPRVSRWIAVSRDLARSYREKAGIEMAVIPNFTEPSGCAGSLLARSGVVFVGRLSREKGVEHVLEAARTTPGSRSRSSERVRWPTGSPPPRPIWRTSNSAASSTTPTAGSCSEAPGSA